MRFAFRFSLGSVPRQRVLLYFGLPLLLGLIVWLTSAGKPLDDSLRYLRDDLRERPASGEVVIVEIDAFSTREIANWPFPRSLHATVIDRLREAGAHVIAFDVDFSSVSEPAEDAALARALERSGGSVILPTFRQALGAGRDGYSENLPIAPLREHAFLGSVNLRPDIDGDVTRQLYGIAIDGLVRPSLAATVAETQGDIGESFSLDMAIDPTTIPRLSFGDILSGRFDPATLREKRVIIGATAIEVGDRYQLPRHGVIPGVVIQALAAETLLHGTTPFFGAVPLLLLAALTAFLAVGLSYQTAMPTLGATALLGGFIIPFAAERFGLASFSVVPALTVLFTAIAARVVGNFLASLRIARFVDAVTDLPNGRAFIRDRSLDSTRPLVAMCIARFDDLISPLSAQETAQFVRLLVARVQLVNGASAVYRVESDILAWHGQAEHPDVIADALFGLDRLLRSRIAIGSSQFIVKANFGIVNADSPDAPTEHLKYAVHAARDAAKNDLPVRCYGTDLAERSASQQSLLAALDEALSDGKLNLLYQPKHRLCDGAFVGAEALVRWQDAERGMISPEIFVPIIEREGWEDQLTMLVLDLALADISAWAERGFHPRIALNFSASLVGDETFATAFLAKLACAKLQSGQIGIEVTETALLLNRDRAVATLEQFRELGCKISIDDYGTGQSTLSYLQYLPADEIKIDQSFIRHLNERESDRIMVRSTIEMAHQLGLSVIAEGIEDQSTASMLDQMQCDHGQGWHYAKPLTAHALAFHAAAKEAA